MPILNRFPATNPIKLSFDDPFLSTKDLCQFIHNLCSDFSQSSPTKKWMEKCLEKSEASPKVGTENYLNSASRFFYY